MFQKQKQSISKLRKTQRYKKTVKLKVAPDTATRELSIVTELDPIAQLLDPSLIGSAIMQCLIENDPEGVMEIIESHLYALNKSRFLRAANVPRSTMYQLLKRKNPTIKTLAKIVHSIHGEELT